MKLIVVLVVNFVTTRTYNSFLLFRLFGNSRMLKLLSLSICCLLSSVAGKRTSDLAPAASFCHNGKLHGFMHAACPGGIRFKRPFTPQNDCLCLNGFFHARDGSSSHVIRGLEKCSFYRNAQIQHLIPLSHKPLDRAIAFWNDRNLEDDTFRRHSFSGSADIVETSAAEFMHLSWSKNIHEVQVDDLCYEANSIELVQRQRANFLAARHRYSGINSSVQIGCSQHARRVQPKHVVRARSLDQQWGTCQLSPDCVQDPAYLITSSPLDGHPSNHLRRKRATPPADIETNVGNENQQLAEYQIRLTTGQVYPLSPNKHKLSILQLSKNVLKAALPDTKLFHRGLLDDAYNHFLYLYGDNDVDDLSEDDYRDIIYSLGQCLDKTRPFKFNHSLACPPVIESYEYIPVGGSSKLKPENVVPVVLDDRKYVMNKNDPIVEIMWKAVDFTHSYCFEAFETHVNLFHLYELEMERLFLRQEIQERWFRDIPNMGVYQIILPYNNLPNDIENLDKVVGSAHYGRVYGNWLKKASTVYNRKKREIELGRDPFSEFEIWDGLAYCLQTNDDPSLITKDNSTWGLLPNLGELNAYLVTQVKHSMS